MFDLIKPYFSSLIWQKKHLLFEFMLGFKYKSNSEISLCYTPPNFLIRTNVFVLSLVNTMIGLMFCYRGQILAHHYCVH